jgi:hypothetical protein
MRRREQQHDRSFATMRSLRTVSVLWIDCGLGKEECLAQSLIEMKGKQDPLCPSVASPNAPRGMALVCPCALLYVNLYQVYAQVVNLSAWITQQCYARISKDTPN